MQKLSESELSIMMKVWEADKPIYLEDIVHSLEEFNWAESTVRNFLVRIIDKGYLKVEKDGRKNIYIPLISKDYINKKGKGIIENLYDNSIKKFVAELYESDSIDHADLLELKDYLDEKIHLKLREENREDVEETKEDPKEKRVVMRRLKNIL